eukprot:6193861-Pleurochrysis_carterae.AAC.1
MQLTLHEGAPEHNCRSRRDDCQMSCSGGATATSEAASKERGCLATGTSEAASTDPGAARRFGGRVRT